MYQLFSELKALLKVKRIHTDNTIMRLHYGITLSLLLSCCIIITAREYVGQPIVCHTRSEWQKEIVDTYCWTHSTYVSVQAMRKRVGVDVAHPGVTNSQDPKDLKHTNYYQWVWFVLFVQAILFYLPRWLWKNWEGGLISTLTSGLESCLLTGSATDKQPLIRIADYLHQTLGTHDQYAIRFFFCEFIALANVCIQFVFLNRFFNGLFYTYGYDVTRYNWLPDHEQQQQVNPATLLFPKVSKCRYLNYGSAGEIVTIDALCILSINVINEKIYLFIWFWFVLLIVLTTLMLTVHLALICCNQVRFCFLTVRLDCVQPMTDARQTLAQLRLGDWFLLYLLSQNLDCLCFGQLLKAYLDRVNRQMNEGGGDLASVSGP